MPSSKKKKDPPGGKASTSSDGPTPTKHKPGTVGAHDRLDHTLPKEWVTGFNKFGKACITSISGGYQYYFQIESTQGGKYQQNKSLIACSDSKRRLVPGTSKPRKCARTWTRTGAPIKTHLAHGPDHLDAWSSMVRLVVAQLWSAWVVDVQNARTPERPPFAELNRLVKDAITSFWKNLPPAKRTPEPKP
jgi:hypothetical protein